MLLVVYPVGWIASGFTRNLRRWSLLFMAIWLKFGIGCTSLGSSWSAGRSWLFLIDDLGLGWATRKQDETSRFSRFFTGFDCSFTRKWPVWTSIGKIIIVPAEFSSWVAWQHLGMLFGSLYRWNRGHPSHEPTAWHDASKRSTKRLVKFMVAHVNFLSYPE